MTYVAPRFRLLRRQLFRRSKLSSSPPAPFHFFLVALFALTFLFVLTPILPTDHLTNFPVPSVASISPHLNNNAPNMAPLAPPPPPSRPLSHSPTLNDPLRSRVDAIVGEGHGAREGLTETYAIPPSIVAHMSQAIATRLYWKLVYSDVVTTLHANHDSETGHPAFVAGARVLFVHTQNGLGNRLRALASGLAIARATRRVPVVVWERDAHLGAGFNMLFNTRCAGSDIATVLYRDLMVMETFPDWQVVSNAEGVNWHSVNYMLKDGDGAGPNTLMRFVMPNDLVPLSEPSGPLTSLRGIQDVGKGDVQLLRSTGAEISNGKRMMMGSGVIGKDVHVYFKSAYVAVTEPKILSNDSVVDRELLRLHPSGSVRRIVRGVDRKGLAHAVGIHIRSRRISNDNVGVDPLCEYTSVGARTTDYWRGRSQLPVFIEEMQRIVKNNSRAMFFVGADDVTVVRKLEGAFPGRIMSIDRDCDDRDDECVMYAMADLLCLAKTRMIYGSTWSSFSETARRLSQKKMYLSGRDFGKLRRIPVLIRKMKFSLEAVSRWWSYLHTPFHLCN